MGVENRSSWIVIWTAFSAGIIGTFIQASVMPIMPELQLKFGISNTAGGLLVSLFAATTLLAAVPAGFFIRKYGVRNVGLWGLVVIFFGTFGCLVATNYAISLTSRIIAGIGFGLISVAAPSAIGQYVEQRLMTIAMAIWAVWIPGGTLIMFITGKQIYDFNSELYWTLLLALLFIDMIAYGKLIPNPNNVESPVEKSSHPTKENIKLEITNSHIWIVAATFITFTFTFFTFNTFISVYLEEVAGLSKSAAYWLPLVIPFFCVCSNLYGGVILQKFKDNVLTFTIPPLFMAFAWLTFAFGHGTILPFIGAAVLGLVCGVIPTIIFSSAPRMAKSKETLGIAMAIIIIGENVGIILGPAVFGFLLDHTDKSFTLGFTVLFIVGLYNVYNLLKIRKTGVFN